MSTSLNIKTCTFSQIKKQHCNKNYIRSFTSSSIKFFDGLPFRLAQDEANKIILEKKKYLEDFNVGENKALIIGDNSILPKECFIPFHSADYSNIVSSFTGQYGIDRTEYYFAFEYNAALKKTVPTTKSRTVTDWFETSGTLKSTSYPFGTCETQIYAGFTYPKKEIEKALVKNDVTNIAVLTKSMLLDSKNNRRHVFPHDMTISYALEKMIGKLHDFEKSRAEKFLLKKFNADHIDIKDLQIDLCKASIQLKSYHLPAFIYKNVKDDVTMYKIVDGYDGKYEGEYALSPIKMFFVGSLIGIGIAPFIPGSLAIGALISRIIIGGSLSGMPFAVYAKYRHLYKQYSNEQDFKERIDHNQNYQSTDDDQQRRYDAEKFNEGYANFGENSERYKFRNMESTDEIKDKLTLLGMDINKDYSEIELKNAYHTAIKKWHPDIYKGDQTVGHKMTIQINESYKILLDKIKKI